MKPILSSLITALFLCSFAVNAQQFSPTIGVPCKNCHPTNYIMSSSPWVSDITRPGGNVGQSWNNPSLSNTLPQPESEYSQGLPVNQGKNSFVTLKSSNGVSNDKLSLTVSGFNVNEFYTMKYYVLSASVYSPATGNSPFGESAKLDITTTDQIPVLVKTDETNFTSGDRNKWIKRIVVFKPEASTLVFTLSSKTAGNVDGYVNFSIDKYPFACKITGDQLALNSSPIVYTIFPAKTLNLSNIQPLGQIPETAEVVWKTGPNSSDPTLTPAEASQVPPALNQDPANAKPYYAFYYAKDFNCYNVPVAPASAELKYVYVPSQVSMIKTYVALPCPLGAADLTLCSNSEARWFTNSTRSGSPITNPTAVPPGVYYAFYYDEATQTYSLPDGEESNSLVTVEQVTGTTQVELAKAIIETPFKTKKLDLNTVSIKSAPPHGMKVVWKFGDNEADAVLTPQQTSSVGISNQDPANLHPYYAFYYSESLGCYGAPVSQAELQFMYVPKQVSLKQTAASISCSQSTVDLTALLDEPLGPVLWYTNNSHSGSAEQNPQAVPPGNYYAFYYESGNFSLPNNEVSKAHVKVENAVMAGIPNLGPTMSINSLVFPQNASKDFVVRIHNLKAENSNCMVYFMVSKMPGFTISYNTQAGQSNVDGGIFNNNDFWTFTENSDFIKVTSKNGIPANGYSDIGFKVTRNSGTPASTTQNLSVFIPAAGGGGEQITTNNTIITSFSTGTD